MLMQPLNAAEIAADSAAVNATSPSNNGNAAGTTSDTPEPIDNTQHSLSSHPDHSDSSPQPIDPCPAQWTQWPVRTQVMQMSTWVFF